MSDEPERLLTTLSPGQRRTLKLIRELRSMRFRYLESLASIEQQLEGLERAYTEMLEDPSGQDVGSARIEKPGRGEVRRAVLVDLYGSENGLSSVQIRQGLTERFQDQVHPKSYLQILKRLKDEGLAWKAGSIWQLSTEGREQASRQIDG